MYPSRRSASASYRSVTGEVRRTLLRECCDALGEIARVAELALKVALDVELLLKGPLTGAVQRLFGARKTTGRSRGKLSRHLIDDGAELRVLHTAPDQTPLLCLLGAQFVPEQCESARARITDQARQQPRTAAVGNQSQLGEGLNERRTARRDDEVTRQRYVRARPGCDSVDGCDDRHRQAAQCEHQRLVIALDGLTEVDGRSAIGPNRAIVQVLSRTEAATRTPQDQHAQLRLASQALEKLAHLGVHRNRKAVEPFWPVECQAADTVGHLEQDGLIGHVPSALVVAQLDLARLWLRLAGENESLLELPILQCIVLCHLDLPLDELGAARRAHPSLARER